MVSADAAVEEHFNKLKANVFRTDRLDLEEAHAAIADLYYLAGRKPPEYTMVLESPLAATIAVSLLAGNRHRNVFDQLWDVRKVSEVVWQLIRESGDLDNWIATYRSLKTKNLDTHRGIINPQVSQLLNLTGHRFYFACEDDCDHLAHEAFPDELWHQIRSTLREHMTVVDRRLLTNLQSFKNPELGFLIREGCGFGNQDVSSIQFLDYAISTGIECEAAQAISRVAHVCGWWWVMEDVYIIAQRPTFISVDDVVRLHNESRAAIEYSDGWQLFYRHGSSVPKRVIDFALDPKAGAIHEEKNAEVRRHLVEIFGIENFFHQSEAELFQEDEFGALYRIQMPNDEPLVIVKVKNSTVEPDGSRKDYFLRVPPDIATAHQAIAWTFGMDPREYFPSLET